MIALSLFDGISGAQLALQRAGIKVEKYYASEIDKYAIKITQKNFPDTVQLGDITKWRDWNIETPDLIIGGFPCQPYSTAGKRRGLEDERGQPLLDSMFDVMHKYQSKDILLENVKGLLSAQKGEAFKYVIEKLNNIGYAVDWKIINSAYVSAQNRERLYVIGKRLDVCNGCYTVVLNEKNKEIKNAT